MSITIKSLILDITDNYGNSGAGTFMGVRSIDCYYLGSKITMTPGSNCTCYATSNAGAGYDEDNAFDTSLSKTGDWASTSWIASAGNDTNQRLIIVFDTPQTIDSIILNNAHYMGTFTGNGIKTTKITGSTDAITDTTFNAAITNSSIIFDGIVDEHSAADEEDGQEVFTFVSSDMVLTDDDDTLEMEEISIAMSLTDDDDTLEIEGSFTKNDIVLSESLDSIEMFCGCGMILTDDADELDISASEPTVCTMTLNEVKDYLIMSCGCGMVLTDDADNFEMTAGYEYSADMVLSGVDDELVMTGLNIGTASIDLSELDDTFVMTAKQSVICEISLIEDFDALVMNCIKGVMAGMVLYDAKDSLSMTSGITESVEMELLGFDDNLVMSCDNYSDGVLSHVRGAVR